MGRIETAWWAALAIGGVLMAPAAQAQCKIGQLLEMPVTMDGLSPIVTVGINGHDERFIADSGAFYSMISPGSAAELSLKRIAAPPELVLGGIGGETDADAAKVQDFRLGTTTLHNVEFIVGGSEVGAVGLLGQNILGMADAEYDLAGGAIRLMRGNHCSGKSNMAYWSGDKAVSVLDIANKDVSEHHIVGFVTLNGARLRAVFDTGAATSMLTLNAAARAGVKPGGADVHPAGISGGIGRHLVRTWIGPFQTLKIGDEEIRKIKLRFADIGDDYGEGDSFDMLIGADFFLSHRVYVSNANHKLYFTYNGGPVFDLSNHDAQARSETAAKPAAGDGTAATLTAAQLIRRASTSAARGDLPGALADQDRAVTLAPDDADVRRARAELLIRMQQPAKALADLNQGLTLRPDDPDMLLMRAQLHVDANRRLRGKADLDKLAGLIAAASDRRLAIGHLYMNIEGYDAAIGQFDQWIAGHRQDSRIPEAYGARCWARDMAGHDFDQALADCNRGLREGPSNNILDSRAMAYLRLGQFEKSIADYDKVIAASPKSAWSLYGRGVARMRAGHVAEGKADIEAATKINPKAIERAKRAGITA